MNRPQIDAWMFLAVAISRGDGGCASLEDMIAAADWINRAIPLDEELTGGLNRLMAAGFVGNTGNTFTLTESGVALFLKVQKRAGVWTQFERLAVAFESLPSPATPMWTPPPGAIEAAITAWHTKAADMIKSMTPPAESPDGLGRHLRGRRVYRGDGTAVQASPRSRSRGLG